MSGNAEPPRPQTTPTQDATTQARLNAEAARTQQQGNMINQNTPFGSLNYSQNGTWADGTPRYTATQSLSPENQKLFDEYTTLAGKYGTTGNKLMDSVSDTFSKPFEFDPAVTSKVRGFQDEFLNPQWDRQGASLENRLANQGITRGSEAWNNEMERFSTDRQRGYDQAYLDTYKTGADMALRERNQPLTELNAFMTGTQPQGIGLGQTPQASVASPDFMGAQQAANRAEMEAWKQEQANSNATMGGLFGLGSSAITGTAFVM